MMRYYETVSDHAYAVFVSEVTLGVDLHNAEECSFCSKNSQFEFLVHCEIRNLKADQSIKSTELKP